MADGPPSVGCITIGFTWSWSCLWRGLSGFLVACSGAEERRLRLKRHGHGGNCKCKCWLSEKSAPAGDPRANKMRIRRNNVN